MTTQPLPYEKGLTYDPHIVWTKPTFFEQHPDAAMFIASVIGGAIVAIAAIFI